MIDIAIHAGYFSIGFLCGALIFVGVYYRKLVELSWRVQLDIDTCKVIRGEVDGKIRELEKMLRMIANADKKTPN
jgi:hypothetical protein